jgi:hypothetical protein
MPDGWTSGTSDELHASCVDVKIPLVTATGFDLVEVERLTAGIRTKIRAGH